jgi:histidinol-phosphate aminotransferase
MLNINQRISGLTPYQPGKPIEELTRELGITEVVKLASNENPRGPGPLVREAIKSAIKQLERYPDGNGFLLKRALARHLEVAEECITLGNGSNDVLDLAARVALSPGSEAIVDEHCFLVYPMVVTGAGGLLATLPSRNWRHDLAAMRNRVNEDTRIVFIANPNNPTGTWVSETELIDFLAVIPESVWVVLDEAYFEYVSEPGYPDGIRLQKSHPNLVVTRTFSKIHALASLRVGYSVSSPQFADLMNRIRQPFNTSSLALAGAEAALEDKDFVSVSKKMNDAGMEQLINGFDLLGIDYIPSIGNFVTFDCARDAMPVYDELLRHGVIVRPLANYRMPQHLRVSIGKDEENSRFLDVLREVM